MVTTERQQTDDAGTPEALDTPDVTDTSKAADTAASCPRKPRGAMATVVAWMGVAFNLAAGAILVWRACKQAPENYWGLDTRLFAMPAAPSFLWGLFELVWWRRRGWLLPVIVIVSAVALAGVVFVVDHWNVLVHYEVWIRRGMPGRWRR